MRIAFTNINANRREGTARAILEVAERLAENHSVDLWARTVEDVDLKKVNWRRVPGPGRPEVGDFASFKWMVDRRLRSEKYDIIHSPGPNTACGDVYAIQTVHPEKMQQMTLVNANASAGWLRRLSRKIYDRQVVLAERQAYTVIGPRGRRAFLPVSVGTKVELLEHYDLESAIVQVVPNGADLQIFHPENRFKYRESIRTQYGFSNDDFILVFSGGDWRRKGLDIAIEALAKIPSNRVKLMVVGDDPVGAPIKLLANKFNVAERVCFIGFQKEIQRFYAAGDVFLFPTSYEAFSLATIEAAASGLPILMPDVSGAAELIGSGLTGTMIRREPAHIAATIEEYVSSPERVVNVGKAARQLVEKEFSWDTIAMRTLDVYNELLENRRVPSH